MFQPFMIIFLILLLHASYSWSNSHVDERIWSQKELQVLASLSLSSLSPLPPSPSNRYANNAAVATLGKTLFFDKRFSGNGKLSCASCHQPKKYFTDGLPRAVGFVQKNVPVSRNTPTIVASAWLRWLYWDGRRDSLWSQALIPFEAANEMGSSRLAVVRLVTTDVVYLQRYQTLFGALPSNFTLPNLPEHAGPLGDKKMKDNWYRLSQPMQKKINRIYANIGKAIAAYERTLLPRPTRFDDYVSALLQRNKKDVAITKDEIAGIKLFINPLKTQCLHCHNGALQTNNDFHNIATGNFSGAALDFGRMLGLQAVLIDEFNCFGPYSDALKDQCSALRFLNPAQHIPLQGAFKTPSLRNLAATAPYFHDGRFDNLLDVMKHYNQPPVDNGPHELKALKLSDQQLQQLIAFLMMLSNT